MILETAMLLSLAKSCQNTLEPDIIMRLINNESSGNPYAIAVKGLSTFNQPENRNDAISALKSLDSLGFNYSVGLMQINFSNFKSTGLDFSNAFDYCANIRAGAKLFNDCHIRASQKFKGESDSFILDSAASCYYSGNFTYGFKKEGKSQISYVEKFNRKVKPIIANNDKKSRIAQKDLNKPNQTELKNNVHAWDVFRDFSY